MKERPYSSVHLGFLLICKQTVHPHCQIPSQRLNLSSLCAVFLRVTGELTECTKTTPECSISGRVNNYYKGIANVQVMDNVVKVATTSFSPSQLPQSGELIMVIQMQGATFNSSNTATYGNGTGSGYLDLLSVGYWETHRVVSQDNIDTIQIEDHFIHPYYSTWPENSLKQSFQVITITACEAIIMVGNTTCPNWDGEVGGVVALLANSLNAKDYAILCDGSGFRGGVGETYSDSQRVTDYASTSSARGARKAEGICGSPEDITFFAGGIYCRGAPGNAGGGGNNHNSGGNLLWFFLLIQVI
jgi:hypothetical protein